MSRPPTSLESVLAQIKQHTGRGDYLAAYDRAHRAQTAGKDHPLLRYYSVLALARSGATASAAQHYRKLRLWAATDTDSRSLWARIRKDAALGAPPERRQRRLERAAEAYNRIYLDRLEPYPGINAATLKLLSGDAWAARQIASALLDHPEIVALRDHWSAATCAEALTILRRWGEAEAVLGTYRRLAQADHGALATTRAQLRRVLRALDAPPDVTAKLLAAIRPPAVVHLAAGEIAASDEADLVRRFERVLEEEDIGIGVGSLWTSGSLVLAERALAHGMELRLVLPFAADHFLSWVRQVRSPALTRRFARCLRRAVLTEATADGDHASRELLAYAAAIADGLALAQARHLCTDCVTVTLSERGGPRSPAATTRRSLPVESIEIPVVHDARRPETAGGTPPRETRAILFADVYKYSTIPESRLPRFWSFFMAGLGEVIAAAGPSVLYKNTWGDALFLILSDILPAAELALAIQERAALLRREDPTAPRLRIGLHHGPVFQGMDTVRGVPAYFGTQVSRAARVEPIAPPDAVYVTEPFAALLMAARSDQFEAEYVGILGLAKKYGRHRMYRLARRWPEMHAPAGG